MSNIIQNNQKKSFYAQNNSGCKKSLVEIDQETNLCSTSNKYIFFIEEVLNCLKCVRLSFENNIKYTGKNQDLCWALWGIKVLRPEGDIRPFQGSKFYKTVWVEGINFDLVFDKLKNINKSDMTIKNNYDIVDPFINITNYGRLLEPIKDKIYD